MGGNDTLNARGGSDTLLGGDGNDSLVGNKGLYNSYIMDGRDLLDGGAGDDNVDNYYAYHGAGLNDVGYVPAANFFSQLDGGPASTGCPRTSACGSPVVWSSAAPTNIEFGIGEYARNFEQIVNLVTGAGNDSITQLGRVDN